MLTRTPIAAIFLSMNKQCCDLKRLPAHAKNCQRMRKKRLWVNSNRI